jgi:hypothetical protein
LTHKTKTTPRWGVVLVFNGAALVNEVSYFCSKDFAGFRKIKESLALVA